MQENIVVQTVTVRLRRQKMRGYFDALIVGGKYDGLKLLRKARPEEYRRWLAVARHEAMIEIEVEADHLAKMAGMEL